MHPEGLDIFPWTWEWLGELLVKLDVHDNLHCRIDLSDDVSDGPSDAADPVGTLLDVPVDLACAPIVQPEHRRFVRHEVSIVRSNACNTLDTFSQTNLQLPVRCLVPVETFPRNDLPIVLQTYPFRHEWDLLNLLGNL